MNELSRRRARKGTNGLGRHCAGRRARACAAHLSGEAAEVSAGHGELVHHVSRDGRPRGGPAAAAGRPRVHFERRGEGSRDAKAGCARIEEPQPRGGDALRTRVVLGHACGNGPAIENGQRGTSVRLRKEGVAMLLIGGTGKNVQELLQRAEQLLLAGGVLAALDEQGSGTAGERPQACLQLPAQGRQVIPAVADAKARAALVDVVNDEKDGCEHLLLRCHLQQQLSGGRCRVPQPHEHEHEQVARGA
mmetsp:Transcript_20220/g.68634  ORF Transcript_20220/g.68634 Transcript_20220/m.68634 type:complete len:248 (+) Transcript_20220:66-809(+)